MLNLKPEWKLILGILITIAAFACASAPYALSQDTSQATIVGLITLNGVPTNGVTVTCGPGSATTANFNGQDGIYIISGLPYGTSMPFSASYQGYTYTDTVDPLSNSQQYYQLPVVEINKSGITPTPTAVPNATVTPTPSPSPNATATPTPTPNATATPTPAPNATVTPVPTLAPTSPPTSTPAPAQPTSPPVPMPTLVPTMTASAIPTVQAPTLMPTSVTTLVPTLLPSPAGPEPTQTRSPGFAGPLALASLLGAAYLVIKKRR